MEQTRSCRAVGAHIPRFPDSNSWNSSRFPDSAIPRFQDPVLSCAKSYDLPLSFWWKFTAVTTPSTFQSLSCSVRCTIAIQIPGEAVPDSRIQPFARPCQCTIRVSTKAVSASELFTSRYQLIPDSWFPDLKNSGYSDSGVHPRQSTFQAASSRIPRNTAQKHSERS